MRVGNVPTGKRQQDGANETLSMSMSKRIKLESDSSNDKCLRRKPPTRGVEQIGYPRQCRATGENYAWYRKQLVIGVKKRLALQSKRVTVVRFLDDAIAFDWILDKSTAHEQKSLQNGTQLQRSGSEDDQLHSRKLDHTAKDEGKRFLGFHYPSPGSASDRQGVSMANPIFVDDADGSGTEAKSEQSRLNPCTRNEGQEVAQEVNGGVTSTESDMAVSDGSAKSDEEAHALLCIRTLPSIDEGMSAPKSKGLEKVLSSNSSPSASISLDGFQGVSDTPSGPGAILAASAVVLDSGQCCTSSSSSSSSPSPSHLSSSSSSSSSKGIVKRLSSNSRVITASHSPGTRHSTQFRPDDVRSTSPRATRQPESPDILDITSGLDTDESANDSSSGFESTSDEESESSSVLSTKKGDHHISETVVAHPQRAKSGSAHHVLQLPKVKHGRARRLLLLPADVGPLMSVTMRGDVQFVDQTKKERLVDMSLPAKATEVRRLEDACLANETAVLGFSKSDAGQAAVVSMYKKATSRAQVVSLAPTPHNQDGILSLSPFKSSSIQESDSDSEPDARGSFEFLSGGYDKTVHHWHVSRTLGRDGQYHFAAHTSPISRAPLKTKINALLHLPGGSRVLAAAGQRLWTLDAEWREPASFSPFSNFVHQLHIHKKNPNIFIAELDHLLSQMQVFDVRMARPGSGKPIMEFGYSDSAMNVRRVRSQKRRGDTSVTYFTRGYHDGMVCLWDYRNVKEPVVVDKCSDPITHTIFAGRKTRDLWAYAGDKVRFIEIH